jgi:cob(I)alamin adenosyltransferase
MREKSGKDSLRLEIISYLNRLSDWMFVMGRWISAKCGDEEVLWTPLGKRTDNS